MMYSYFAYGLTIHSEIELSGMPPGEGSPDLTIAWGRLTSRDFVPVSTPELHVTSGYLPPAFLFKSTNGQELILNRSDQLDEATARTHLMGVALAAALRQRGLLVLHASCVVKDGEAIGFLGPSGWGKSTLASYFYDHGYDIFCDDVMAIQVDTDSSDITVLRGASQIRLRPDAGQWLHPEFEDLPQVMPGSHKRMRIASSRDDQDDTARLTRLYLLDSTTDPETTTESVSFRDALISVFNNTHAVNLLKGQDDNERHFRQCTRMVREIPVRRLKRVYGLEYLPTILQLIETEDELVTS